MESDRLSYQIRDNGVAVVRLNRPAVLNAVDSATKTALGDVWTDIQTNDGVRAVVLCGAGERAFCAGSDITEMARTGHAVTTGHLLGALPGAAQPLDKPLIAALHGYCLGMGLTLAIHADIRLAAPGTVLGFPEVKHGMMSAVSAVRLPRIMSSGPALEMLLTGEPISAEQARDWGLVNRIVPNVQEEAERMAAAMAAMPAPSMLGTARLGHAALATDMAVSNAEIGRVRDAVHATPEFAAGARRFKTPRP